MFSFPPESLVWSSLMMSPSWSIKALLAFITSFPKRTSCSSHTSSVASYSGWKPSSFKSLFLWRRTLLYWTKEWTYTLSNWHNSMSIKRLRSEGPFLMIFKSSGEKNPTFTRPNSWLAFLIGMPSTAIPLVLFFFKCISMRQGTAPFLIWSLMWDSSSPNRIISLSFAPLWDLVVQHT